MTVNMCLGLPIHPIPCAHRFFLIFLCLACAPDDHENIPRGLHSRYNDKGMCIYLLRCRNARFWYAPATTVSYFVRCHRCSRASHGKLFDILRKTACKSTAMALILCIFTIGTHTYLSLLTTCQGQGKLLHWSSRFL
jgi:hypothetical protein